MHTLVFVALFAVVYAATTQAPHVTTTPATKTETGTGNATGKACENGWLHYEESCYWFSRWGDKKKYAAAKTACSGMEATLFVSDSKAEFDAVAQQASRNEWSWIGLTGDSTHPNDAKSFKWETLNDTTARADEEWKEDEDEEWKVGPTTKGGMNETSSETSGGMNPSSLPWLNKAAPAHGHLASSNCAAYYGGVTQESAYVNWYNCDTPYHYICEINSTAAAHH